jgi:hypothetical protein
MTTVLGRDGATMVDAVISDSLRRARPTRFSGSDLSRPGLAAHAVRPSGTPASRQFWLGALRMQGFSQNLAHPADASWPHLRFGRYVSRPNGAVDAALPNTDDLCLRYRPFGLPDRCCDFSPRRGRIAAVWRTPSGPRTKLGDLEPLKISPYKLLRSRKRDRSMLMQRHLTRGSSG